MKPLVVVLMLGGAVLSGCAVKTADVTAWDCYRAGLASRWLGTPDHARVATAIEEGDQACSTWKVIAGDGRGVDPSVGRTLR